ncbi:ATP-dependent RNA helicase dbp6 [Coemansia sp. RSA 990]|nr:ATP-dependent RNA helicase dbp6 [Coemansia sp. RSA 1086]KAJ1749820.1 ATP-dependent RNA helicase dbp6 [Coemansia sp. RSA 1821]KAJ1871803.1 ATP-dependent RNA helicase dbp6 [Coemansia sp. RSA 990]
MAKVKSTSAEGRSEKTEKKSKRKHIKTITEDELGETELTTESSKKLSKHDEIIAKKNRHAKQPNESSLDAEQGSEEPVVTTDGLERFPDFSQAQVQSEEMALKAAQMGIPRWLTHPTTIDQSTTAEVDDDRFGLSVHVRKRCKEAGVKQLFAVQAAVIPVLRAGRAQARLRQHVRDLCVSAPTGSGKTLAFVIPIVERLRVRVEIRLRALIVLPTKELARQVRETFMFFATGTDVRVGLAVGDVSMSKEQAVLVGAHGSRVDVLVCTPGRLTDHISQTSGFSLEDLEFLVMDEADRLLSDSNHGWLRRVQTAISVPARSAGDVLGRPARRVQRLLFSATLTQDAARLARVRLERPLYIAVAGAGAGSGVAIPATLSEFYATCPVDEKPLWLIYLLWHQQTGGSVCFTKSLEATHRLAQIVHTWAAQVADDDWPERRVVVAEYSSDLPAAERSRILKGFREGAISVLICSDLIARGLDIDQVDTVINYDVPTNMSQYTHRVGRTARAGRHGKAYTLVAAPQMFHFKQMMQEHKHWHECLTHIKPQQAVLEKLRVQYNQALETVGEIYT